MLLAAPAWSLTAVREAAMKRVDMAAVHRASFAVDCGYSMALAS